MTEKEIVTHLEQQMPNPYINGTWYKAHLPNQQPVEITRTRGRGKMSGNTYLHIRKQITVRVVHPDGSPTNIPARQDYIYFRANLKDCVLKEYY